MARRHLIMLVVGMVLIALAVPGGAGAGGSVVLRAAPSAIEGQARSISVRRPATVDARDVLVAVIDARLAHGDRVRAPASWSLVGSARSTSRRPALTQYVFVHLAGAADPRRFRFRTTQRAALVATLLVFGGADRTRPLAAISTWPSERALSSPDRKLAKPGDLLVVGYATSTANAAPTPRGMHRRVQVTEDGPPVISVAIATRTIRAASSLPKLDARNGTAFAFVVTPSGTTPPADGAPGTTPAKPGTGTTPGTIQKPVTVTQPNTEKPTTTTAPPTTTAVPPTTSTPTTSTPITTPSASPLFLDQFNQPDGLITNEYAFFDPGQSDSVVSPLWQLDSGSLFALGNTGWTGVPDDVVPNARSTNGNDSAIFRLVTKRNDFANVSVSLGLDNQGLVSTPSTPTVDWDGVHIFLRYQSEFSLYYASINRRDGTAVIKKKVPGGPDNGGTYYELTPYVSHAVPYGTWQAVRATVKTNANGSVTIDLYAGGQLVVEGVDNGVGGPPITSPGRVGLRGDNCNFRFKDFRVDALS
jgi:hypothetical protein